jgi:hypothetical protein
MSLLKGKAVAKLVHNESISGIDKRPTLFSKEITI